MTESPTPHEELLAKLDRIEMIVDKAQELLKKAVTQRDAALVLLTDLREPLIKLEQYELVMKIKKFIEEVNQP